jgi:muramoyltetrapeptide carboxypeptidase
MGHGQGHVTKPARLRAGSRIALVAPAGPVTEERVAKALAQCAGLGFEGVLGESAMNRFGYLAGTDEERSRDLQAAFADDSIDAVWALRGGYGGMRLLANLNWQHDRPAAKAFVGFSDNTTLHLALFHAGITSFHGPHAGGDFPAETRAAFERVLCNPEAAGMLPLRAGDPEPSTLRSGKASGILMGGNLALLAAACGTDNCLQARGCIVFIEDVSEPAYRVDRMFRQLIDSGAFVGVAGFAFGRFTEVPAADNDRAVNDVLREFADELDVPAVVDFPIGHIEHNWTLPIGVLAELDANAATLKILEPAVS